MSFLANLVVEPDLCNLRCAYCWLTSSPEFVVRSNDRLIPRGTSTEEPRTVSALAQRVSAILRRVDASVLKVSGGEIGMLPEVLDVVESFAHRFLKVQILTNGLNFGLIARRSLSPSQYCFQVSLDSHLPSGNEARFDRAAARRTREVLETLSALSEAGYDVEINCVVTPSNIEDLPGFTEHVAASLPKATLVPFPARFTGAEFSLGARTQTLDVLVERHAEWRATLPPLAYLEELRHAVRAGKRVPCVLPVLTTTLDDEGEVALCPCGDLGSRGNLLAGPGVPELSPDDPRARAVMAFAHEKCRSCYTHFDVINLFFSSAFPASELTDYGMFRDKRVLAALVHARERLFAGLSVPPVPRE